MLIHIFRFHRLSPLGRVGHRVTMSVCVSVIKFVIDYKGQRIRVFFFVHKIEWDGKVLGILNLEEHKNCMIHSKVTMILTMFFVHDWLGPFGIWNQSIVDNGGVNRGRSVAVGISDR